MVLVIDCSDLERSAAFWCDVLGYRRVGPPVGQYAGLFPAAGGGLQLLLQTSAVGAFLTLYIGDISHLLAAAPAAVVQARYSQDLEQQADDYGAQVLLRNGMSPGLLADALQKLAASHPGSKVAASHPGSSAEGYLSSHPSTDARMRHLRLLAASNRLPK